MSQRHRGALPLLAALALLVAACSSPSPTPSAACPSAPPTSAGAQAILADAGQAVVKTNKGSFTIELYDDRAPIEAANFVALARCGFYDGISFHRVIAGFVIQAGDPQTKQNHGDFEGLGSGGPGYRFSIASPAPDLNYDPYAVAMAADSSGEGGSQFFIDLAALDSLPGWTRSYTIFGKVVSGTDVIDTIGKLPVNDPQVGVPLDPAIIESITIQAAASPSASGG
ncbi:MAG TPA: peptidylprolyl isomerase [Candidatus Limnocylindria bacterium]|nr:peptidylprolyl isomerase [Candidatus Limnocylindria bacterium]